MFFFGVALPFDCIGGVAESGLGDVAGVAKRTVELLAVQWTHVHVRLSVGGEVLVYGASVKKW